MAEERHRFLFSPWHLVLIPLTIVMLIPLVWMLVTSVETLAETQHYPPVLIPQVDPDDATTHRCCATRRSRGGS